MPFKIEVLDHNFLKLLNYPESVKKLLSYTEKEYNSRSKRYTFSYHSLIDFDHDTSYAGLAGLLKQEYPDVIIEDFRVFPDYDFNEPKLTVPLRPYQIDYLIEALRQQRYIIHAKTGLGKTLMIAAILDALNLRTLILAPNKTIMGQLQTELTKLLPHRKFGLVGDGQKDLSHNQVIGLTKSLSKLTVKELTSFKVLLIDEAHTAAAIMTHDLIQLTNAPFRFGFSGTPFGRSDNRDLVNVGLIGPIGREFIDRQEAVQKGYLADTRVLFVRGWFGGSFIDIEDMLIVNNQHRNNLIYNLVKKSYPRESIIILVRRIDHGNILQQMIGPSSIFIDGTTNVVEREDVRKDIKNGKYRVLIATKVFYAGLDLPNLEVGINAKGGKAEIDTGQGVGRVVRSWRGVAKLWVDIFDEWCDTLENHSKERIQVYHDQDIPVDFIDFPPGKERMLKAGCTIN